MNKIIAACAAALALAACDGAQRNAQQSQPRTVDMRNLDEEQQWDGIEANPSDPNCAGAYRQLDPREIASVTNGPPCRVGAAMYGTRRVTFR
jgi:hypothetical protein